MVRRSITMSSSSQWQKLKQFEQHRVQNTKKRQTLRRADITEKLEKAKLFVQEQCQQDIRKTLEDHAADIDEMIRLLDGEEDKQDK
jgi:hypothetical protein